MSRIYHHKISGVYAIRKDDRSYIGSSINIHQRWTNHRSNLRRGVHHSPHLQNAWNKYGESAFEFVVLEECAPELLLEREQHYLDLSSDSYNCCPVFASWLGRTHTPEAKAKMRAAKLGRKHTAEARERMQGNRNRAGTTTSPEGCANISSSKMGNTYRRGKKATPETRAKMQGNKNAAGRIVSDETRERFRRQIVADHVQT